MERVKMLLGTHGEPDYQELGRLAAGAGGVDNDRFAENYLTSFMTTLRKLSSVGRQCNVLQHAAGFFKR